jgi:hypothetical protein
MSVIPTGAQRSERSGGTCFSREQDPAVFARPTGRLLVEFPALLVLRDILLQLAVERGLADAQHSRRQKLVAIELGNRARDSLFFQGVGTVPKGPSPPELGNLLLQVSPLVVLSISGSLGGRGPTAKGQGSHKAVTEEHYEAKSGRA